MNARTRRCTAASISGRRRKAVQFSDAFDTILEFADESGEVADACVTLAVHAGIAASDVLCCTKLGHHAVGAHHAEAIDLLKQVRPDLARQLATLLKLKQRAGYGHDAVTRDDLAKARRAMVALVEAALAAR